ncbi:MAG TPA: class I SAM-dependent methyltransferase [Ignavibacteria bacterium]
MKEFWDKRYSDPEYVYGKQPNEYFSKVLDGLKPGKLLLPGEGEGRNAIYAAKKGWEVTAIDFSLQAKEKAIKFASENNVEIDYIVTSIENYSFPEREFDAAALIYAHFPPDIREKIHTSIAKSLRPGGTLIIEAFSKKQIYNNTGGPKELFLLYEIEELRNDFRDLIIEESQEFKIELTEGKYHKGIADIIRLKAKSRF